VNLVEAEGFAPIMHDQLGELLTQIWVDRFGDGAQNKQYPDRISSSDGIQTMTQLATAGWAEPEGFAERWEYQPGDFWVGRCPRTGVPLGHYNETHVLTNAGSGQGKGTTLIIPNHLLWPGSLVSLDPKGENASLTSARRGDGNDVCLGLGQKVRVLDPMGIAEGVEDKYRACFNPLDALDPNGDRFIEKASAMADAMVVRSEKESDSIWNDKARSIIKGVILHVKTAPDFGGEGGLPRNLNTVYDLICSGDERAVEALYEADLEQYPYDVSRWEVDCNATPDGIDKPPKPKKPQRQNPFDMLFRMMKENKAVKTIPSVGNEMLDLRRNEKGTTWLSFHTTVKQHLEFLESPGIQRVVSKSDFDLSELKEDPDGASWFLCLSLDDMVTYNRWLRLMVTMIFYEARKNLKKPANKHRVLMCLDEFETIGHLRQIEEGLSTLRAYHVKLLIVTQYLAQIKKHYEKSWQAFHANVGLRIFFGVDNDTAKELSDWMGESEYVTTADNQQVSISDTKTGSRTQTTGDTRGGSETETVAKTQSESTAEGVNESVAEGTNQTTAHGTSDSRARGVNESTAKGVNQSAADGENTSDAHGTNQSTGENTSFAEGDSQGHTEGISTGNTDGGSVTHSENQGTNWNVNEGQSQTFEGNGRSIVNLLGLATDPTQSGQSRGSSVGGSEGTGVSNSRSWSRSDGRNSSDTDTHSETMTRGASVNRGTSDTKTVGRSRTLTKGHSLTQTEGTSTTDTSGSSTTNTSGSSTTNTRGKSLTQTRGSSQTESQARGKTWSKTASVALGQTQASGQTLTMGRGQTIHKRPLMFPADIHREFMKRDKPGDIGAPGYALALVDGERPAIIQRSEYFDDLEFDAFYDRHPEFPDSDPIPLLRDGVVATRIKPHPQADEGEKPRLFWAVKTEFSEPADPVLHIWYKSPGEKIRKGEPLYSVKPGVCIAGGFSDDVITFHAPYSGTIKKHRCPSGETFEPADVLCDVEYHIQDLWDAIDHPVMDVEYDNFRGGKHPIVTRMQRRFRELVLDREEAAELKEKRRLAKIEREEKTKRKAAAAKAKKAAEKKRAEDKEYFRRILNGETEEQAKDDSFPRNKTPEPISEPTPEPASPTPEEIEAQKRRTAADKEFFLNYLSPWHYVVPFILMVTVIIVGFSLMITFNGDDLKVVTTFIFTLTIAGGLFALFGISREFWPTFLNKAYKRLYESDPLHPTDEETERIKRERFFKTILPDVCFWIGFVLLSVVIGFKLVVQLFAEAAPGWGPTIGSCVTWLVVVSAMGGLGVAGFLIGRRIWWAIKMGELVDENAKVIEFDPLKNRG